MRVTTKGRYALRALVKLALEGGEKPIPIKRLAEAESISPEFLEQIFFRLKKSGVIDSVRGPGGGFVLRMDPEISASAPFSTRSARGSSLPPAPRRRETAIPRNAAVPRSALCTTCGTRYPSTLPVISKTLRCERSSTAAARKPSSFSSDASHHDATPRPGLRFRGGPPGGEPYSGAAGSW